jgi:hypothetical protein
MLIAYKLLDKIKIMICETDESREPVYAIQDIATAERILAYVRLKRTDITWSIERHHDGKYGVCGH